MLNSRELRASFQVDCKVRLKVSSNQRFRLDHFGGTRVEDCLPPFCVGAARFSSAKAKMGIPVSLDLGKDRINLRD